MGMYPPKREVVLPRDSVRERGSAQGATDGSAKRVAGGRRPTAAATVGGTDRVLPGTLGIRRKRGETAHE
ncbi:hypothetical protein Sviol_50400 [Streptomyces violascens]|uniref:Uncharacterized protein n=1 Tax=Streptomyces violascens TaxID=67381 RepID=A0ABQ3QTM4_9ACTN|nr:hypothetical protein Sviol_50400 [Streptomyces violascens]